jgi:hypothetical protein
MRILFVIALLGSMVQRSMAGCENSTMMIRSNSGEPIKVYIDGGTGDNPATPIVTVTELTPGSHTLKVVAVTTDENGQTQRQIIFGGDIQVRSSMYLDAKVEPHKGVSVHETRQACGDQPTDGVATDDNNNNAPAPPPAPAPPANTEQSPPSAATTQPPAAPAAPKFNNTNLPPHLSDADFEAMKNTIAATQYEIKKMDTLKILSKGKRFAASQVSDLMGLFAFESDKLDVAKLLYDRTVDKSSYHLLAADFLFDTNKQAFKKFLARK